MRAEGLVPQRRKVAAALSAAVTTTKQQETAPNSHGRTSPKERTSLFPATLRERGSGGEALLLEKRPLPQNLPPNSSLRKGARGRGLLYREAPSLASLMRPFPARYRFALFGELGVEVGGGPEGVRGG